MNNCNLPKSILLLAANPKGSISLRLHEEEREIKERLRFAEYGKVPINSTGATRPRDVQQAMLDFKPQIVHFSGHGAGQDGLVFEDDIGQGKLVSSEALTNLFRIFSNYVECVILNACYSKFQAEAISQYIGYVVGTNQSIGDRAAIAFARGFYTAIGAGESIDRAYELGCNAIQFEGIPEHLTPVLYKEGNLVCPYSGDGEQPHTKANRRSTKSASKSQTAYQSALKLDTRKFRFEYAELELKTSGMFGFARKPEIKPYRKEASHFIEDLGSGIELEIVAIPCGDFLMGSSNEENKVSSSEFPQHQVSVAPFFLSKYLITQMQWKAVASLPLVDLPLKADPSKFKGDRHPVERVCWDDAVEFCKRLAQRTGRYYRLPSEAEWEYACRSGTTTLFHFGDIIAFDLANYDASQDTGSLKGIFRNRTTPVDNFKFANAFGIYDMHGNVWEWCMDHWHSNYKRASNDARARGSSKDSQFRVIRGGSWADSKGNCRSANRKKAPADERTEFLGFRVACS